MAKEVKESMTSVEYNFTGRKAIITGAARGQGLAHAKALAKAGAEVALWDLGHHQVANTAYKLSDKRELDIALAEIKVYCPTALAQEVDVASSDSVQQAVNLVQTHWGGVDILINNAGVNAVSTVADMTLEDWELYLRVNLTSVFLCSKALLPSLRSNGAIVNISSMAAFKGVYGQAHYAAAKAGVVGFTRAFAVELAPHNIRVNAICPSLVLSPQSLGLANTTGRMPIGRGILPGLAALQPENVTDVVLWLCSDAAKALTGSAIQVDAGSGIV